MLSACFVAMIATSVPTKDGPLPAPVTSFGPLPAAKGNISQPQAKAESRAAFPSDSEVCEFIRPYVDNKQAKGIIVGLVDPDGRRRVLGLGDAGDAMRSLSSDSIFEIGSITKTFVGALLADMVRRGEVKLDDPVARYLPATVRVPSKNGRQITLVDLATHSSGLPSFPSGFVSNDPTNPYAHYKAEDLYEFLSSYELQSQPGTKLSYSNLGMGLLGFALVKAAKAKDINSLLKDRILRPLKMTRTVFGTATANRQTMTRGHDKSGKAVSYFNAGVLAGGGGLNSNVIDLMTYLDANIGAPHSKAEESLRDAQRGIRPGPGPGMQMGLGWISRISPKQTLYGHNGGTAGYSTYIAFDPNRRTGVVVLANTGGFEYSDYIGRELLNPERKALVAKGASIAAKVSSTK